MQLAPLQIILAPLGLIFSLMLVSTGMRHTSVQETSPIMSSAEAVQRWADHESVAQQCLRWSIDVDIVQEDGVPTDSGKAHFYARLQCSHRGIYLEWAILIAGPWLFMNLVLLLVMRMVPAGPPSGDHTA